jgi:hypothetical protein
LDEEELDLLARMRRKDEHDSELARAMRDASRVRYLERQLRIDFDLMLGEAPGAQPLLLAPTADKRPGSPRPTDRPSGFGIARHAPNKRHRTPPDAGA